MHGVRFFNTGEHEWELGFWVQSDSKKDLEYFVTVCLDSGEATCECMDYSCRKCKNHPSIAFGGCKHIQRVLHVAKLINRRKSDA